MLDQTNDIVSQVLKAEEAIREGGASMLILSEQKHQRSGRK
jgi:hypothetical protein